ncbi:MAG: 6-phosphogluconolactonase [Bacteroidia bacterium]|nr:6-phosphogluconolactonase [Bacteroidia bacterium]
MTSRPTINSGMHDAPVYSAVPESRHFKTKEEFDEAVGKDFILHANQVTGRGERFLVGLSHGQSPAGPYRYILEHYSRLKNPGLIRYTFVHSRLKRQRDLEGVLDARQFLLELRRRNLITSENVLGTTLNRESIEAYAADMEEKLGAYLIEHKKEGFDYVFIASDPSGRIGAISRNSKSFGVEKIGMVVHDRSEKEITATPWFLSKSRRIAFLATKSDKRRALAWLFNSWGKPNESPSFIRFIPEVEKRVTVFIDDKALTWPQLVIKRQTPYGVSNIRVDTTFPFSEKKKEKLPVVLLIHGFLGLNTFDGLLTSISTHKYIAAAMHYGSIPSDLPPADYSEHVVLNIDAVVNYFGSLGHPVYIFDHSMANTYFLMIDRQYENLIGIRKYLRGRIGANPFFGEEAQHALIGFMDNVLLPSEQNLIEKAVFMAARNIIPWDFKKSVRRRSITMTEWFIHRDASTLDRVWKPIKDRIFQLMSGLGSLPNLDRVPITRALNRLPAKVFAIQTHSALLESTHWDDQKGIRICKEYGLPVLILKSEHDPVARYVPRFYDNSGVEIQDVTNFEETDPFREHLYHMVHPRTTARLIEAFIQKNENKRRESQEETLPVTA